MKKFLIVLGLSAIAMAGRCSDSDQKSSESSHAHEEFPVKEESQVPAEEVPSYEQEEAQPADGAASPAPAESGSGGSESSKPASND